MMMPYESTLGKMKEASLAEATVGSEASNMVSQPPTKAPTCKRKRSSEPVHGPASEIADQGPTTADYDRHHKAKEMEDEPRLPRKPANPPRPTSFSKPPRLLRQWCSCRKKSRTYQTTAEQAAQALERWERNTLLKKIQTHVFLPSL